MGDTYPARGLIVELISPIDNGKVDGRGLGRLLDRVLPHVEMIYLFSPKGGMGRELNVELREELFDKSLVVIKGRVPIMVWVTQDSKEDTKKTLTTLKRRVKKRRYSDPVLWVDSPLLYHSNRGLMDNYRELLELVSEPFLLHNIPDLVRDLNRPFKRKNIRTSILRELIKLENIKALIHSGEIDRAQNYQKAVSHRKDFRIYDGNEANFLRSPSMSGVVSVGANLSPKSWSRITHFSIESFDTDGQYPDELKQIWRYGQYVMRLLELYSSFPSEIIRGVLSKMGILKEGNINPGLDKSIDKIMDLMKEYHDH